MKALVILLLGLLLAAPTATGNQRHVCSGFMPSNTLWLPAAISVHSISKSSYDRVLDRVQKKYDAEFQARGKTLEIVRSWSDGTVNAQAWQEGDVWKIEMFGGMARYSSMTADAFMMVACHEIGHHIGGAPKYAGWASNEGQSDYFAALKCARGMIAASMLEDSPDELADLLADVSDEVKAECASQMEPIEVEQVTCMRLNQAAVVLAGVLADLNNQPKPKISTPDTSVVMRTKNGHPAAQCRLDTMYQASLCISVGDLSDSDPAPGTCHSTSVIRGGRPFCWFKP